MKIRSDTYFLLTSTPGGPFLESADKGHTSWHVHDLVPFPAVKAGQNPHGALVCSRGSRATCRMRPSAGVVPSAARWRVWALTRAPERGRAREGRGAGDLSDLRVLVGRALRTLSAEQREVLELRIVRELDYPQIARRLGISEPTARARVSRGLRGLAAALDAAEGRRERPQRRGAAGGSAAAAGRGRPGAARAL